VNDISEIPRLRFKLPLDAARLLRARERVRDYLHGLCPDDELVDAVVLCVEEAGTNAIRHSRSAEAMDVSLAFDGGSLVADVRDRGRGFDVGSFDPDAVPDLMADGGRGLFLIARLMDEMSLRVSDGLHVHMVKREVAESRPRPFIDPGIVHGEMAGPRQTRLLTLLEEIDEAFVALDWQYRIVHINEAAVRLAGKPMDRVLGITPFEIWPEIFDSAMGVNLRDAMELGRPSVSDWIAWNDRWHEVRFYPTASGVSAYVRDIDERKRAELAGQLLMDELRRSEARFRAAFEQAAVGVIQMTLDGRFERVNERFCDLVGYSRDELKDMTFRDITHHDDVALEQRHLDAPVDGKGPGHVFEKRYRHKNGGVVWASLAVSLVRGGSGSPDYFVAVVQDVSAQKRAAELAQRYELLTNQARDVMLFVRERDGAIMEANSAAEQAYGYQRRELLGLTIFDLRAEGRSQAVRKQMGAAARGGVLFETVHRRSDGSTFPVEVSSRGAMGLDGDVMLISVVRDVSERVALSRALADERDALGTVMANTNAQVAYLDEQFRYVLVNDAFAAGSAMDCARLIGCSALGTMPGLTGELFEQVRRAGEAVEAVGRAHEFADRPERGVTYWDWRLAPVTRNSGEAQGFVLSRVDVTERVRRGLYAEGLSDVLERLGESRDPDELARILAEGVRGVLGADGWSIWGLDVPNGIWTLLQADESMRLQRGFSAPADSAPYATEAHRTRGVVAVEDCDADPRGRPVLADIADARSLIAAPLPEFEPANVLFFSWRDRPRVFTGAEIDFVARAAATAASAMSDALLYKELEERERFAHASNDIAVAVTSMLDRDQILRHVVRQTAEALGAESGVVSILEDEAWVPRYVHGMPDEVLGKPIPMERVPYANIGVRDKQVVAVDDCETDPRVDRALQQAWGVRAVMMAPLIVRDDVIGVIFLNYQSGPHRFSPAECRFISSAAAIISGALEIARLYQVERHVVSTLQEAFVHPLPGIGAIEIEAVSQRAYEPDLVGGDFCDVFELDGGLVAVAVGDVEGKGVRAAGLAETVRATIRAVALMGTSPAFILGNVNQRLIRDGGGQLVTAALVVVDPATGEVSHASAGHPPALMVSRSRCAEVATSHGTPLGTFDRGFVDRRVQLQEDDVMVLYTDGLTEVRRSDEQFGVTRALEAACCLADGPLDDLVIGLRDAAVAFGGEIRDDMQIVAFRLSPGGRG
jgi:PAS domain S-box-containing protein